MPDLKVLVLCKIVDITLEKICKVGSLENKLVESDGAEYVAQLNVGSDGMTSDSNHDMKLTDENFDDTNIVATDLVLRNRYC